MTDISLLVQQIDPLKFLIFKNVNFSLPLKMFMMVSFDKLFFNHSLAPINSVAISKDKMIIASACYDGSYHILDLSDNRFVHSWKPHDGILLREYFVQSLKKERITKMIISNDKKIVITASRDLKIKIFDFERQVDVAVIEKAHKGIRL